MLLKFVSRNLFDSHSQRKPTQVEPSPPSQELHLFPSSFLQQLPQAKNPNGGLQGTRKLPGPQKGGWGREEAWQRLLFAQGRACSLPAFAQLQAVGRLLFNPEGTAAQSPAHLPSRLWVRVGWAAEASLKFFHKGLPAGLFQSGHFSGSQTCRGQLGPTSSAGWPRPSAHHFAKN